MVAVVRGWRRRLRRGRWRWRWGWRWRRPWRRRLRRGDGGGGGGGVVELFWRPPATQTIRQFCFERLGHLGRPLVLQDFSPLYKLGRKLRKRTVYSAGPYMRAQAHTRADHLECWAMLGALGTARMDAEIRMGIVTTMMGCSLRRIGAVQRSIGVRSEAISRTQWKLYLVHLTGEISVSPSS